MKKICIIGITLLVLLVGCNDNSTDDSVDVVSISETEPIVSNKTEEINKIEIHNSDEQEKTIEPEIETKSVPIEAYVVEESSTSNLFKITAYCACEKCCGKWANGITATGTTATEGRTIAVDPSVIPYGTNVIINGNTYIAEDCGGGIDGNSIDIFFDSHDAALQWGVQYLEVEILYE